MRQTDDFGGQTFLLTIELADLHLVADGSMHHIDPCQCDRLLQNWGTRRGCDHSDLRAADMDAIAMADGIVAIHIETNEDMARVFLAPMPASNGSVWSLNS